MSVRIDIDAEVFQEQWIVSLLGPRHRYLKLVRGQAEVVPNLVVSGKRQYETEQLGFEACVEALVEEVEPLLFQGLIADFLKQEIPKLWRKNEWGGIKPISVLAAYEWKDQVNEELERLWVGTRA